MAAFFCLKPNKSERVLTELDPNFTLGLGNIMILYHIMIRDKMS